MKKRSVLFENQFQTLLKVNIVSWEEMGKISRSNRTLNRLFDTRVEQETDIKESVKCHYVERVPVILCWTERLLLWII